MNTQTPESPTRQETITNRLVYAQHAIRITTEKIKDTKSISSEIARRLAGDYVSYMLQASFHGADQIDDITSRKGRERSRFVQQYSGSALAQYQHAIAEAMSGNWIEVKKELTHHADICDTRADNPASIGTSQQRAKDREEAKHFRNLAEAIPDNGPSSIPPLNAHQDTEIIKSYEKFIGGEVN